MERRTLLRWLIAGAAAWPLRGVHLLAQAAALPEASVATLRGLAPAVLPSALGAAGHDKVVSDFLQWLASYRAGAERNWGYGHPEKSTLPAIEAATYRGQLDELEERARRRGGTFAAQPVEVRRAIATEVLDALGARGLSGSPDGRHVISDFMTFYFSSSAATDLCYRARIGAVTCRGLAGAAAQPAAIAGD